MSPLARFDHDALTRGPKLLATLPWIVLLAGVLFAGTYWYGAKEQTLKQQESEFGFLLDRLVQSLDSRILANEQVLLGVAGLFNASGTVERDEFRAYVATLSLEDHYPGILGVGFAEVIEPKRLDEHVKAIRSAGFPDYQIRPPLARDFYTSIVYLEPLNERNLRALGFDMFAEPVRHQAMARAAETSEAALSGKVTLVQESGQDIQAGVLLYVPIYKTGQGDGNKTLAGWSYSPLRMNDMINRLLQHDLPELPQKMAFAIYDGRAGNPDALLFQTPALSHDQPVKIRLTRQVILAGQPWTISAQALPGFFATDYSTYQVILAAVISVTLLLVLLANTLVRSHARMQMAASVTQQYKALVDSSDDAILIKTLEGVILSWNYGAERIFGYSGDEIIGKSMLTMVPEECVEEEREILARIAKGERVDHFETVRLRKDGKLIDISTTISPIVNQKGQVIGASKIARDISERRRVERELKIAAATFESQEGFVVTDANNVIMRVNPPFTKITGYTAEEVVGRPMSVLKSNVHDANFYSAMWRTILSEGNWHGEIWNRLKNGEIHPHEVTISAVVDASGRTSHYVGGYTDITERKAMEEQIRNMAFHDALTGLPNRRLLEDHLKFVVATNERNQCFSALLFLDLDNFKPLNDRYGHEAGDQLLIEVANRLRNSVREVDFVSRFGGDEFVVILAELATDANESAIKAQVVAEKVRLSLSTPYAISVETQKAGRGIVQHQCTTSIGVTLFSRYADNPDELIDASDALMYQAKAAGKNQIRIGRS